MTSMRIGFERKNTRLSSFESSDLTRQISFLVNNFVYQDGEDPDNACILLPRYKALGRVGQSGKRYPMKPIANPNEDDLVPVRSIITKSKNRDIVTPDLIGTNYLSMPFGTAIGISFGTSLTEAITQGALALKHGGHERVIDETGYLRAPKAGTMREEGKWLFFEPSSGSPLKYPRPENLVRTTQTKFVKDDLIGTAYHTTSPVVKLNSLLKLLRAKGNNGTRYYEKENVIVSDCYAYEGGKIQYTEEAGDVVVTIGGRRYAYNPECVYYYPEGTEIKKFQRFCSGVVDMSHVVSDLGGNIQDIYQIFRKQVYSLIDPGFVKKGYTDLTSIQEELIETLFTALVEVKKDAKDEQIESVDYLGTHAGIMSSSSFYTVLSYGYSSRVVASALRGEVRLEGDVMTETVLGLLLNNKLDDIGK